MHTPQDTNAASPQSQIPTTQWEKLRLGEGIESCHVLVTQLARAGHWPHLIALITSHQLTIPISQKGQMSTLRKVISQCTAKGMANPGCPQVDRPSGI